MRALLTCLFSCVLLFLPAEIRGEPDATAKVASGAVQRQGEKPPKSRGKWLGLFPRKGSAPASPAPPSSATSTGKGAGGGRSELPVASARHPYRVQFGAFRKRSRAEELSGMLDRAGISTSVYTANGLIVVVTDGGFRSAEEAARWIDFEGTRRGWTERPVVIR